MLYTFQSRQPHNFVSILKRSLYKLLWPIALLLALQLFFTESELVKDNSHFYILLVAEAFQLFSISRDSINEIIIDTSKKILQANYYNFFQGQIEAKYALNSIKVDISKSGKNEVREITFFSKKKGDFTLKKEKDNFSQQDIESLSELLYQITISKKN